MEWEYIEPSTTVCNQVDVLYGGRYGSKDSLFSIGYSPGRVGVSRLGTTLGNENWSFQFPVVDSGEILTSFKSSVNNNHDILVLTGLKVLVASK